METSNGTSGRPTRRGRIPVLAAQSREMASADLDPNEVWYFEADYHRSPLGLWTVTVSDDIESHVRDGFATAHDALHHVMDFIEVVAGESGEPIATMHVLDGDPAA